MLRSEATLQLASARLFEGTRARARVCVSVCQCVSVCVCVFFQLTGFIDEMTGLITFNLFILD